MNTSINKSVVLAVRVTPETRSRFNEKAQKFGYPSEILREIVEAFLDDRLHVTPPATRKESIYGTGK